MTTPLDMSSARVTEHIHDLHATAAHRRLVASARRPEPASRRRVATLALGVGSRMAAWVRRGQLGPAYNYCGCP